MDVLDAEENKIQVTLKDTPPMEASCRERKVLVWPGLIAARTVLAPPLTSVEVERWRHRRQYGREAEPEKGAERARR